MKIEKNIAIEIKRIGGQTYYVGGYVRDQFLGIENKDTDIEVHGVSPQNLYKVLNKIGKPLSYGKSFGVYSLKGYNIDIALPRSEVKIGKGHKDFRVDVDPNIGTTKAIQRRDFTINAIYKNVLTGKIVDPFNGVQDIKSKTIRYVDEKSFPEDPLRVLRGCQFASRFNFKIDNKTINLCKDIDLTTLSKQRVEDELKKCLLKGKPSIFFKYLNKMNQNQYWFKEIKDVNDKAIKYRDKVNHPYEFMLTSLCLNLSRREVDNLLDRFISKKETKEYILNMYDLSKKKISSEYSMNKMFDSSIDPIDLIYIRSINKNNVKTLNDKYYEYQRIMSKPYLKGKDIQNIETENKENYSKALKYAYELRLKNVPYDKALKLTVNYLNKLNKISKSN